MFYINGSDKTDATELNVDNIVEDKKIIFVEANKTTAILVTRCFAPVVSINCKADTQYQCFAIMNSDAEDYFCQSMIDGDTNDSTFTGDFVMQPQSYISGLIIKNISANKIKVIFN